MGGKKAAVTPKLVIPDDIKNMLICLNVAFVAMAQALAKAQPASARLFVQELRGLANDAKMQKHEKPRVQLEKYAKMVEHTLSQKPQ